VSACTTGVQIESRAPHPAAALWDVACEVAAFAQNLRENAAPPYLPSLEMVADSQSKPSYKPSPVVAQQP